MRSLEIAALVVLSCAALYIVFIILSWLFLLFVSLTISLKKEYDRPSRFYSSIFNFGYFIICLMGRVRIHHSGTEKLPEGCSFLFISNHRSKFDNMVESLVLRKYPLAFISKEENFRIPIGRRFMKRGCYLALKRGHPKEGLLTIMKATELVASGNVCIGVFPEGTRSRDCSLLPFMPGCFRIQSKSGCPVVIAFIRGTENIHRRWPWRHTDVYLDIVQVLSPEEIKGLKTVELSAKCEKIMQDYGPAIEK